MARDQGKGGGEARGAPCRVGTSSKLGEGGLPGEEVPVLTLEAAILFTQTTPYGSGAMVPLNLRSRYYPVMKEEPLLARAVWDAVRLAAEREIEGIDAVHPPELVEARKEEVQ